MLTTHQIDRLVDALRQQGAPVVDLLAPGLSDRQMDELTAPLDIRLPDEARTWWGHYNGAPVRPGDESLDAGLSPSWWWAPLENPGQRCRSGSASVAEEADVKGWGSRLHPAVPALAGSGTEASKRLPQGAPGTTDEHREAAQLLRAAITRRRTYDAMIVHVKQQLPGMDVYGRGLDRASELLRAGDGIDDVNIAHVPYPNR
jgi:hypothetical protein